jgi:pimeloyl-ACP methyl ester carboxylesterase
MRFKLVSCLMIIVSWGLAHNGAFAQEPENSLFCSEEITVQAGDFTIVGDLYIPAKGTKHPAVVWVHGSGPLTRQLMVPLIKPQIEIFLKAGFAFFIDDIPGAGSSKGEINNVYKDRALILAKEIEALKRRPDIIPTQIGVAGASQAGIVMPLATTMTSDIAFMITEACVGESAYKQDAYLVEQAMICEGLSPEEAKKTARFQRQRYETENFQEYISAVDYLDKNEMCRLIGLNNPPLSEERFKLRDKSPSRLGSYYDPMPVVAGLEFPILALFGEKDKNIDPVQGFEAYRRAFKTASNSLNRVEMIANANHALFEAKTGCVRELGAQVGAGKSLYAPQALNIVDEWLQKLKTSFDRKENK